MDEALIKSPIEQDLRLLFTSCESDVIIVCPYITSDGLDLLISSTQSRKSEIAISLLTDIHPHSLQSGSLEIDALISLWDCFPKMTLAHLRGLHAKVYIVDRTRALVTSANLTFGGMRRNFEYALLVSERSKVGDIANDMLGYFAMANEVPYESLKAIGESASDLRKTTNNFDNTSNEHEFDRSLSEILRPTRNMSSNSSATDATAYQVFKFMLPKVLIARPMALSDLKDYFRKTTPHLCDDRVIYVYGRGNRHRPQWEQDLRQALNTLKIQRMITHEGGRNGFWRYLDGA